MYNDGGVQHRIMVLDICFMILMICYHFERFCLNKKAPAGMVELLFHDFQDLSPFRTFLLATKIPCGHGRNCF